MSDVTIYNQLTIRMNSIDSRVERLENAKLAETPDYVSHEELQPLTESIAQLDEEVDQYRQDVRLWNQQVDAMFGEHNARYFQEGRDK